MNDEIKRFARERLGWVESCAPNSSLARVIREQREEEERQHEMECRAAAMGELLDELTLTMGEYTDALNRCAEEFLCAFAPIAEALAAYAESLDHRPRWYWRAPGWAQRCYDWYEERYLDWD